MEIEGDRARQRLTIPQATAILSRTPPLLETWLRGLPDEWVLAHEGRGTWSPLEVVGHLVLGEQTNWMPRLRHILAHGDRVAFPAFKRTTDSTDPIDRRLDELARLRAANLTELSALHLDDVALERTGQHPALGTVTVRQLLAAWVAHDLDHVTQIARVLATQYQDEVGPWRVYLRVISGQPSRR
jgi:hypothetical protein